MVDFPFGSVPTKEMPASERMNLLRASVRVIETTHVLAIDERISDWIWYFRGYVQWHSLAIVVAELGCSTNVEFTDVAWQVLDPVLSDWDAMYKTKKDEPAWEHVNMMIERARHVRRRRHSHQNKMKRVRQNGPNNQPQEQSPPQAAVPINQAHGYTTYSTIPIDHTNAMQPHHGHMQQPDQSSTPGSQPSGPLTGHGGMMDFNIDFDTLDAFDNIDFSAFDQVFNSESWEMLSPLQELEIPLYTGSQAVEMQQQAYR